MSNREHFQRRAYHYLSELRNFLSQSPLTVQTGISDDVLTQLAQVLAGGVIFDLVSELAAEQRTEEQTLHSQLVDLRSEQSAERTDMRKRHREAWDLYSSTGRTHHLPVLQKTHEQERQQLQKRQSDAMNNLTTHVVQTLDSRVATQQRALEHAGLGVFMPTTDPSVICIQMRILDWIMRLAQRPLPSDLSASSSSSTSSTSQLDWQQAIGSTSSSNSSTSIWPHTQQLQ